MLLTRSDLNFLGFRLMQESRRGLPVEEITSEGDGSHSNFAISPEQFIEFHCRERLEPFWKHRTGGCAMFPESHPIATVYSFEQALISLCG